jgi:hypothetical protein
MMSQRDSGIEFSNLRQNHFEYPYNNDLGKLAEINKSQMQQALVN